MSGTWVQQWVDEHGARSGRQAERRLRNPKTFDHLIELAAEAAEKPHLWDEPDYVPEREETAILAAGAIDLSGEFACGAVGCLKLQVDDLFSRVWHYFDTIIVRGPSPEYFLDMVSEGNSAALSYINNQVELLQYLQETGADKHLTYRRRRHTCGEHLRAEAQNLGLAELLVGEEDTIQRIALEADLVIERESGGYKSFFFSHPDFEAGLSGRFPRRVLQSIPEEELRLDLAARQYVGQSGQLINDVWTARRLSAPLASQAPLYTRMLGSSAELDEAAVALQLRLPTLEGLPTKTLLSIIDSEPLELERFRSALRAALKEQVEAGQDQSGVEAARRVVKEVLEPALNDIEQKFIATSRLTRQKIAVDLLVGTAVVTAGVVTGVPLLAGTGVAAVADIVKQAQKHLEERRDLRLSDMYFLWHLDRQGARHAPHS